ncbi:spondin domain-containing protein [Alteromonas facilis]|uniref:spondin domain-containing protein n=1 Tax=Alteromonas facilis TaxID=2048004 RepID=UPI000C2905C3|nr:spondin domain-containing protein [Alteromonas facilis]
MRNNWLIPCSLVAGLSTFAATSSAAEIDIEIQNLTRGIYFTPLLVAAHPAEQSLFSVGEMASSELQAMAEAGDISGLENVLTTVNADMANNPAGGLLGPTQKTMASLSTEEGNSSLSIVGMMLPTNDGFIGLNAWPIPSEAGTYTVYLNAYDAGTEANDEIRGGDQPNMPGMPVPPPLESLIATGGSGVTTEIGATVVHIHPGNLGDHDESAGISDISNTVQRWLNPVAKITITVSE